MGNLALRRNASAVAKQEPLNLSAYRAKVKVKAGDKWLIGGATGAGKTTFTKALLRNLEQLYPTSRIYILDTKYQGDFDDYDGVIMTEGEAPPRPRGQYQVWQPIIEIPEEMEKWLYKVRKDPPSILVVDELLSMIYKPNQTSLEYSRILKMGRALPVGVITLTQELAGIPRNAMAQRTHVVRFYMGNMPYEVNLMNKFMKDPVEEPADTYGFYYQHASSRQAPQYFADYRNFFGI